MNKRFKFIISLIIIVFCITYFNSILHTRDKYVEIYNKGVSLLEEGNYEEAIDCFSEIPNYIYYKDISELLNEYGICPYCGSLLK